MSLEKDGFVMSREETTILKGCAILIMIFLHLFNDPERVALCYTGLDFHGEPLVLALSRCAGICVPLYVFLSGYGLFLSRQSQTVRRNVRRVTLLYVRFWLVLFLFLPLASWLRPDDYPGSFVEFLYNFTGLNTTYNGEWWFLLPYALLAVSSGFLLDLRDRWGSWLVLFFSGTIYFGTYLLFKYSGDFLGKSHVVALGVNYLNLLFSFMLGACCAHAGLPGRLRNVGNKCGRMKNWVVFLVLLGGFYIRMLFYTAVFNPLYAVFFVCLFMLLPRPSWLASLLRMLGVQSVNMWLVHSFFCYHLFSSFTYGLHYPVLIFLFVVVASLLVGFIIDLLYRPLQRFLFSR